MTCVKHWRAKFRIMLGQKKYVVKIGIIILSAVLFGLYTVCCSVNCRAQVGEGTGIQQYWMLILQVRYSRRSTL